MFVIVFMIACFGGGRGNGKHRGRNQKGNECFHGFRG